MTQQPNGGGGGSKRLRWPILAALAGPSMPLAALSLPMVVFLPEFYSGELGLDLSLVGAVFMIVRLADIAFDPLIGGVMDRTRTPLGRYRPWLLAGAPMVMLGMGMLFMASPGVGPIYLAGWLALAYAGWSTVSLAQLALSANVSPDYRERSRIYGWWQAFFMIGLISVMLLPKAIASMGYGDASTGMKSMAWLVIILMPLFAVIAVVATRERDTAPERHASGLREYFALLKLDAVRKLLAAELFLGLVGGCTSTLTVFFFTRAKDIERVDTGLILVAHFVVGLATTPVWTLLANRMGKHRALALSALIYSAFQLLFLILPSGDLALAMLCSAGAGLAYGATALLPRAMMADVSDEERLRTGADRTGLFFALLIGVWKIGQAVSVGLMLTALEFVGFDATAPAAEQGRPILGLYLLYAVLPSLLSLMAAFVISRYPLTAERHAEIRRQLEQERDGTPLGV